METVKHDADLYQAESDQRKRTSTVDRQYTGIYGEELVNTVVGAGQASLTWERKAVREGIEALWPRVQLQAIGSASSSGSLPFALKACGPIESGQ